MSKEAIKDMRTILHTYLNSCDQYHGEVIEVYADGGTCSPKAWSDAVRRAFLSEGWLVKVAAYRDKAVVTLRCRV